MLMEKPTPHYKMRPHKGSINRAHIDGLPRSNYFSRRRRRRVDIIESPLPAVQAVSPPTSVVSPESETTDELSPLIYQQPSLLHKTIASSETLPGQFGQWIEPQKKPSRKHSRKRMVLRLSLIVISLVVAVGGWLGWSVLGNLNKVFHGNIISDAQALFSNTALKGENQGRVNILLAGDSTDDPGHAGAVLTDSILLLSINTKSHSVFLLSIPRDLWVNVPGVSSYQKINAANADINFKAPGYPSGGMGQLEQIVQTDLGIPVDYYGLMDYGAFKDSVNAVGGVTINIQSPDPRGLYDPNTDLKLPNGLVTLNGQEALNLARARGDGYGSYGFPNSDFARTEHQRQLFIAVAEKAKTIGVVANPLKISSLFSALGNNFQTDLSLQEVLQLVQLTKNVNPAAVQSYTYPSTVSGTSSPILKGYIDPGTGEDALIPTAGIGNYSQLAQYYKQLTSATQP
jgi:LCP family protein required for cell wall assembly